VVNRVHFCQTRLNSDEARQLSAMCTIRGMSRSAYIRRLIQQDIAEALRRRDIIEQSYPQQFDERY
jgi:hypothetical protein